MARAGSSGWGRARRSAPRAERARPPCGRCCRRRRALRRARQPWPASPRRLRDLLEEGAGLLGVDVMGRVLFALPLFGGMVVVLAHMLERLQPQLHLAVDVGVIGVLL